MWAELYAVDAVARGAGEQMSVEGAMLVPLD
jgi:hypothetical protein